MDEIDYEPPAHLSKRAAILWRSVAGRRAMSLGRLAMLQSALEALDRADAAREVVSREGMTTTTQRSGVQHLHPLLKVEKESRHQFTTLWGNLGFNREANQGDR